MVALVTTLRAGLHV